MVPNLLGWLTEALPSWMFGAFVFLLMLAAAWLGTIRRRKRRSPDEDASSAEGYIVSGLVGLLALLLGFTFSLAVDRFDARRLLVVDEANAIRTTYLRAQTFGEPHRDLLSGLLVLYADNHLALGGSSDTREQVRLMAVSQDLQNRLWTASLAAIAPQRDDISSSYMDSLNQAFETGASRRAARESHVPSRVFVVLLVYMVVTAFVLGFVIGRRHVVSIMVLLLLTSMSYALIFDIDGATSGGIRESQRPMQELTAQLRGVPPTP